MYANGIISNVHISSKNAVHSDIVFVLESFGIYLCYPQICHYKNIIIIKLERLY